MPFGLDFKSFAAGIIFMMFVWPLLMQVFGRVVSAGKPRQSSPRS